MFGSTLFDTERNNLNFNVTIVYILYCLKETKVLLKSFSYLIMKISQKFLRFITFISVFHFLILLFFIVLLLGNLRFLVPSDSNSLSLLYCVVYWYLYKQIYATVLCLKPCPCIHLFYINT